ncbi:MAG: tRNA uridine-5-carboxymethylaminomethyl(34) synthesis GTPase MnmE [Pseudomonadota bacterium]
MALKSTIAALSSGAGRAGIAVIRVSGGAALEVLDQLAGSRPPAREARLRVLRNEAGDPLDEALVLWFPEGASFTGEDLVELHCHGSFAVVRAVLSTITEHPDSRLAEPGEFTLRAFQNGRIDLAGAEALGDLINAETEEQRKRSVRMLGGDLHRRVNVWRQELLHALALVEVTIDWADEEVPEDVSPEVSSVLDRLIERLDRELETSHAAERLRVGFEVALLGAPNSGKSSFINYLSGREAAITSPIPGTTRDIVELRYDLAGIPVHFLDMAGLRDTDDPVESEGVRRACTRAEAADLRLKLVSPDAVFPAAFEHLIQAHDIQVLTKRDLWEPPDALSISSVTGAGVGDLLKEIETFLANKISSAGILGHARQKAAVEAGRNALDLARNQLETAPDEVIAEHLRLAARELARVIGAIDVEDVLGDVFANFCMGK